MSARLLAVINALVAIGVIAWNGWTGAKGLAGNTVGGLSDRYDTLFTPAGYAFSIWGIIFLGLILNAGYQLWLAFTSQEPDFFRRLGPWLILTNLCNGLWIWLWLTEQTAASVLTLAAMFVFIQLAMVRLDMELWDAPLRVIALVWWPIVVYAGWITVAVLANLASYLAKEGVVPGTSAPWAIGMIALATLVNLGLIWKRNLREHAGVAVWAFIAIAVKQWGEVPSVQWTAVGCAALLSGVISAHAFRNRATLPFVRRS
ncbi:MAG: hypothetical protein Q8N23_04605 [Archangium sp.]|nr:hypothetical protein [Archangium sp.]MDP3151924.1 hypothetical protein [Archangium sp.]MDP3571337.1 hypothetical protein [Archangium sp.]